MRITDIKVFPVREEKLKAFVSIVIDDCFMVNDIKVIKGADSYFISMPSRRKHNGKFKDIAHPLNNETRQAMEEQILGAYEEALAAEPQDAEPARVAEGAPGERKEGRKRRRRRRRGRGRSDRSDGGDRGEPRAAGPAAASVASVASETPQSRSVRPEPAPAVAEPSRSERAPRESEPAKPKRREPEVAAHDGGESDKSADEVAEMHLRDSFWGT